MYNTISERSELTQSRLTFCNPWTVADQVPPSMGFSTQEYRSGLPFPSPGDLPYPGIEPGSSALQADFLPSEPPGKPNFSKNFKSCINVCSRKKDNKCITCQCHSVIKLWLYFLFFFLIICASQDF